MALETFGLMLAGPIVGSFLGCVADRLPRGRPLVGARSACDHCAHVLTPASLVPIASWVWQRGRCRHCEASVSPYYPIMELTAAAIVVVALLTTAGPIQWVSIGLGWTLLTLAAMDVRHMLLSNVLLAGLLGTGVLAAFFWSGYEIWEHLLGAAVGAGSLLLINAAYRLLRGQDGLGAGDIWLLAAAGAWLTARGLPSVVLIAAVSALIVIGVQQWLGKAMDRMTAIPFGAFLCLGFWLTWICGPLEFGTP